MKNKILLVFICCVNMSLFADYESIKEYKKSVIKKKQHAVEKFDTNSTNEKLLLEVRYYDINKMDTEYLEKMYDISLWNCIADGICIFKYNGNESREAILNRIRTNEKNIKNIKQYEKYNFKTF